MRLKILLICLTSIIKLIKGIASVIIMVVPIIPIMKMQIGLLAITIFLPIFTCCRPTAAPNWRSRCGGIEELCEEVKSWSKVVTSPRQTNGGQANGRIVTSTRSLHRVDCVSAYSFADGAIRRKMRRELAKGAYGGLNYTCMSTVWIRPHCIAAIIFTDPMPPAPCNVTLRSNPRVNVVCGIFISDSSRVNCGGLYLQRPS